MSEFHRALEKAELHVHLEGSVDAATLCDLDHTLSADVARRACRFDSFDGFMEAYKFVVMRLNTPRDYALITRRLLERMAFEKVRYAEINLSVGVMLVRQLDAGLLLQAIFDEAARQTQVEVRWIYDAVRQFGPEPAQRVFELAAAHKAHGVIGVGIGGAEALGPARNFAEAFAWARSKGLHVLPHAGETVGPDSIWQALEVGAKRIGHGIRAVEDPVLLAHLRDREIPLEVCIWSNVATGSVPSIEAHPVRRLFDAGVPITLNTDDPAMFETTLEREFETAETVFGFTPAELQAVAGNGFRYALPG